MHRRVTWAGQLVESTQLNHHTMLSFCTMSDFGPPVTRKFRAMADQSPVRLGLMLFLLGLSHGYGESERHACIIAPSLLAWSVRVVAFATYHYFPLAANDLHSVLFLVPTNSHGGCALPSLLLYFALQVNCQFAVHLWHLQTDELIGLTEQCPQRRAHRPSPIKSHHGSKQNSCTEENKSW